MGDRLFYQRQWAVKLAELMNEPTYWNGEPCKARIVIVEVGKAAKPTFWYAGLEGTQREAVEVTQDGQTFYLDNEDGSGWRKITVGKGSPQYGHASLAVARVIKAANR